MKKLVRETLESARANLDKAISDLETIPEIDAETIGYTAHKLNNYLTVVSATAELLEVYLAGQPDEEVQVWIETLQHAVQLMKHDTSRLMLSAQGTEPRFKLEKVDMALLAFRGCNFYRHKAAWKKIQVNHTLQPDCCFARTDRVAVSVVLDNLLSNALKFSENGKQVWVDVAVEQDHIVCTVRDEGPGLSREDQARLFQKGIRLSNSPTGGEPSLGYGLVIARDLVERLGGRIWCESRPGKGASFHFRLPAFSENVCSEPAESPEHGSPHSHSGSNQNTPVQGGHMALKVNTAVKRPGVFVVAPIGSIDGAGQAIFQEKVDSVLYQNPDVIIFDMEFADYINSMGIRVLVKTKKAMKRRGGKIVFINLQPQIKKVFDILNALPSLKVFANIQELDSYLDAMQTKSQRNTDD